MAVLQAVCQEFKIEIDNDVIRRIAFGFAGGIGNTGAVCGAVVGAEMGNVNCREHTGADLTNEEGIKRFMNSDTRQTVCFPAVSVAYRIAVDLLNETSQAEE